MIIGILGVLGNLQETNDIGQVQILNGGVFFRPVGRVVPALRYALAQSGCVCFGYPVSAEGYLSSSLIIDPRPCQAPRLYPHADARSGCTR